MSASAAAVGGVLLLGALGALPVVALVGLRWLSLLLAPIAGAVVTGLAAALALGIGGPLVAWSWLLAGLLALGSIAWWAQSPARRPRRPVLVDRPRAMVVAVGGLASLVAAGVSLRGLATPTVGFDARALWALRAGWLLHDHQQMVLDFSVRELKIGQSGYPPLASAAAAFAGAMSGVHAIRVEVVVVALLDVLGLLVLAAGILAAGRAGTGALGASPARLLPVAVASLLAPAVVLVGAGITEPFLTNGYADPLWSICAAGALLLGLVLPSSAAGQAAAVVLLVGAGMTKQEGMLAALCLLGLLLGRQLGHLPAGPGRSRRLGLLAATGLLAVGAMAAWPAAIAATGSRQVGAPLSPQHAWGHRAHAVATGFAPSLHVLVLALVASLVGGLALRGARARVGLGNDLWGWAGLLAGLLVVSAVLITGSAAVVPWIAGSVHRVTQFPALAGWLLVATWAIVGATAVGRTTSAASPVPAPSAA